MQLQETGIQVFGQLHTRDESIHENEKEELKVLTTFTGTYAKKIKDYGKHLGIVHNAGIVRSIVHRYFDNHYTSTQNGGAQ